MDAYVKRIRSLMMLSLVLFATVVTFIGLQNQRAKDLWGIEEAILTAALLRSEQPTNGSIPVEGMETEFVEGAPYPNESPNYLTPKGRIIVLIKDWDEGTYTFRGVFTLSNGEQVQFARLGSHEWDERAGMIRELEEKDKDSGRVIYQVYDISSPAFAGQTHKIVLADASVQWMHFDYLKKEGWGLRDQQTGRFVNMPELAKKVTSLAEPWIGTATDPEGAFLNLRGQHRRARIKVPILSVEVPGSAAAVLIGVTGLWLSILLSHTVHGLEAHANTRTSEAWVVIPPYGIGSLIGRRTVKVLSGVGALTFGAGIVLPLLSVLIGAGLSSVSAIRLVVYALSAIGGILTVLTIGAFLRFLSITSATNKQEETTCQAESVV